MKKLLLGLSAVATVITPAAIAISCGSTSENKIKYVDEAKNIAKAFGKTSGSDVSTDYQDIWSRNTVIGKMTGQVKIDALKEFQGFIMKGLYESKLASINNYLIANIRDDDKANFIDFFTTIGNLVITTEEVAKEYGINLEQATGGIEVAKLLKKVTVGNSGSESTQVKIGIVKTDVDDIVDDLKAIMKTSWQYTAFEQLETISDEEYTDAANLLKRTGITFAAPTSPPSGLTIKYSHVKGTKIVTFNVSSDDANVPKVAEVSLTNFSGRDYTDVIKVLEEIENDVDGSIKLVSEFKAQATVVKGDFLQVTSDLGIELKKPTSPKGVLVKVSYTTGTTDVTFIVTSDDTKTEQSITVTITNFSQTDQQRLAAAGSIFASISRVHISREAWDELPGATDQPFTQDIANKFSLRLGDASYLLPTTAELNQFSATYSHTQGSDSITVKFNAKNWDGTADLTEVVATAKITLFIGFD